MSKGKIVRGIMKILGKDEALQLAGRFLNLDGGPGSGNFGHKGRPGKVGGSGAGGGSAFRTQSSGGSYVGVQKAAAFRGIKKVAQRSKDAKEFIDNLSKEQRRMVSAQHRQSGSKERIMDYAERLRLLMASQKPEKAVPFKIVEGKDISDMEAWDRKPYTEPTFGQVIDTDIEHVIAKQGFNGPPKVVSQQELMDIIDQHPEMPVLFRSYAALGEEAVQAYDDMLENGEWYVDCSNGGAQYGQGMYCAGVYGSSDYSGALSEMQHYRHVSMKNAQARWCPALKDDEDRIQVDGKSVIYRQADMKKTEDNTPPEVQDVVAMVKTQWTTETVKGYFMPMDPEDPESPLEFTYYTDVEGHKTVPAEKVPYWGPISRTETPPAPAASTRMMTLDPSAKIISHKDAQALMDGELTKEQRKVIYQERLKEYQKELDEMDLDPPERLIREYAFKGSLDLITPEDRQAYLEAAEQCSDEERKFWLDLGHRKGSEAYRRTDVEESLGKRERSTRVRKFGSDVGVCMAALGYDAINAEGHGETNSYTVILNRTKLIISQSRVDIAS